MTQHYRPQARTVGEHLHNILVALEDVSGRLSRLERVQTAAQQAPNPVRTPDGSGGERDCRVTVMASAVLIAADTGLPIEAVLKSRDRVSVEARDWLIADVSAHGFAAAAIGRALGMDHTSILSALGREAKRQERRAAPEFKSIRGAA